MWRNRAEVEEDFLGRADRRKGFGGIVPPQKTRSTLRVDPVRIEDKDGGPLTLFFFFLIILFNISIFRYIQQFQSYNVKIYIQCQNMYKLFDGQCSELVFEKSCDIN